MNDDNSSWVFRGGSWFIDALSARVAYRSGVTPSGRNDYLGFRLSRVVKPLQQLSEVCDEER